MLWHAEGRFLPDIPDIAVGSIPNLPRRGSFWQAGSTAAACGGVSGRKCRRSSLKRFLKKEYARVAGKLKQACAVVDRRSVLRAISAPEAISQASARETAPQVATASASHCDGPLRTVVPIANGARSNILLFLPTWALKPLPSRRAVIAAPRAPRGKARPRPPAPTPPSRRAADQTTGAPRPAPPGPARRAGRCGRRS
jgi:hypothetical protein